MMSFRSVLLQADMLWALYSDNKKQWLILGVLSGLYLFSRLLFLDSDIPAWAISYYCPVDEFYYTATAFDWVEGIYAPNGLHDAAYFNFVQQLSTALSLFIFGDNYYGLRIPSVLAGFVVLTSFYWLALKRFGIVPALCLSLLLIFEFSFGLATRIAEPTIFRLAAVSVLVLIYTLWLVTNSSKSIYLIGVATGIAWFFVYPTNAFVALAGFCIVYVLGSSKLKCVSYYSLGVATSLVGYVVFLYATDFDPQKNLAIFQSVAGRVAGGGEQHFWLVDALKHLLALRYANFFVVNPAFLFMSISFIGLFLYFGRRLAPYLKTEDYIVLIFSLAFLAQTMFVNDYPQRKLVVLLPLLLYFCFMVYSFLLHLWPTAMLRRVGGAAFVVLLASFLYGTLGKIYFAPEFKYKAAMESLSYLNGERVIGGWGYGFRLYNSYKPYLNKYTMVHSNAIKYYAQMKEGAMHGDAGYTIEYGDKKTVEQLALIGFEKYKLVFKSNDPVYPDVYLFKYSRQPAVAPAI